MQSSSQNLSDSERIYPSLSMTSSVFTALSQLSKLKNVRILFLFPFTIIWPCIVTDSLWIKPTDALKSSFIGITILHVSGSLSAHHQEFLDVHRLWHILCNFDDRLLLRVRWNRYRQWVNIPVICFIFGLMMAQWAETCRRIFNIDYQYMLCFLTE